MQPTMIVLDGLDGSGKQTQAELLLSRLLKQNKKARLVSFPDYNSKSSALVEMYLAGELSSDVQKINAYAASSFYAVDRYASYLMHWKSAYEQGEIIIANRYVTSNMIHQMSKLPQKDWDAFIEWLEDYEYNRLGLPRPNLVLFLDVLPTVSQELLSCRYGGDESKKDLHEQNAAYLNACQVSAHYVVSKHHWTIVCCCDGEKMRSIEQISSNIFQQVSEVISTL